jgi:hypothetical protein
MSQVTILNLFTYKPRNAQESQQIPGDGTEAWGRASLKGLKGASSFDILTSDF